MITSIHDFVDTKYKSWKICLLRLMEKKVLHRKPKKFETNSANNINFYKKHYEKCNMILRKCNEVLQKFLS